MWSNILCVDLTVFLCEKFFVLYPEEKRLEDEGDDDGHDDHGEDVERHEEDAGPFADHDRVALHYDEPVVDNCKQIENIYFRR